MVGRHTIAYSIHREGFKLDIALVEANKLLLHEETIPDEIEHLTKNIMRTGYLKDPVIVDRDSLIVLDGMHRVTALRILNCRFIPVCLVNYKSSKIKVERWCRVYQSGLKFSSILKGINKLGITLKLRDSKTKQTNETEILILLPQEEYNIDLSKDDVIQRFNIVAKLELWLNKQGVYAEYQTEQDARERLRKGEIGVVLCPPIINKTQVVEVAKRGDLFPFKATRHILPARPMLVKVPLDLLKNSTLDLHEVNRCLYQQLNSKIIKKISHGGFWEGRRYDEDIYVFHDP